MNTNITAQLNEIRRQDLLREAEHQRLAPLTDHRAARNFRLVPRWRRGAGSPIVRAA